MADQVKDICPLCKDCPHRVWFAGRALAIAQEASLLAADVMKLEEVC